jgi:hypothetical protein
VYATGKCGGVKVVSLELQIGWIMVIHPCGVMKVALPKALRNHIQIIPL